MPVNPESSVHLQKVNVMVDANSFKKIIIMFVFGHRLEDSKN